MNVNDLPNWQKRGIGVRWMQIVKEGVNPMTGKTVQAIRRRLGIDLDLPLREEYDQYLTALIDGDDA